jgi:hypothetical protein
VKGRPLVLTFVLGTVAGVIGATVVPRIVSPYFPAGEDEQPELYPGVVRSKELEDDRLLLTLVTSRGTMLAIFTANLSEIGLLVERGDSLTLALREYSPFVTDPDIYRVGKSDPSTAAPAPVVPEAAPAPHETGRDTASGTPFE